MSITSFPYILFLAAVFLIYFILPQKVKPAFLLLASLFFYFTWRKWAPLFMLLYALFIYIAAFVIGKQKERRLLFLVLSVGICIAGFFLLRYTDLPSQVLRLIASPVGITASIIFPLGFSYYMFKSISYLIDVYFEKIPIETRYDYLLLHFCFFPEISMGPITRAADFLTQIHLKKELIPERCSQGFILILWGFFKKLVFADRLSITVSSFYNSMDSSNGLTWLIISFAYLIQLYLDFSGYTDISVGISRILGYDIKHNFNAPFYSQTISEFWRNWNMSFSHWLADYIFKPLQHKWRKYGIYSSVFAAMITLSISSLWHGVSFKFIIYGVLMGAVISIDSLFSRRRNSLKKELPKPIMIIVGISLTMFINMILFVFARVNRTHDALVIIYKYIFDPTTWSLNFGLGINFFMTLTGCVIITIGSHAIELKSKQFFYKYSSLPFVIRLAGYYALILGIMFLGMFAQSSFIYFQF